MDVWLDSFISDYKYKLILYQCAKEFFGLSFSQISQKNGQSFLVILVINWTQCYQSFWKKCSVYDWMTDTNLVTTYLLYMYISFLNFVFYIVVQKRKVETILNFWLDLRLNNFIVFKWIFTHLFHIIIDLILFDPSLKWICLSLSVSRFFLVSIFLFKY